MDIVVCEDRRGKGCGIDSVIHISARSCRSGRKEGSMEGLCFGVEVVLKGVICISDRGHKWGFWWDVAACARPFHQSPYTPWAVAGLVNGLSPACARRVTN